MQDRTAACIKVDNVTGIVRIDGVPAFRLITMADGIYVQFQDGDKLRSRYRGDRFVEIPLEVLAERLKALAMEVT